MSKPNQEERVLQMLTEAGATGITKADLGAIPGLLPERLPVYIWMIRKKLNIAVETLRDGKRAVGYRLATAAVKQYELEPATV